MKNFIGNDQKTLIVGAAIAALAIWYFGGKIKEAAKDAGEAINPLNNQNIFNRAFESVGQFIAQDESWTLGGMIYDWTHPDEGKADSTTNQTKQPAEKNAKIPELLQKPYEQSTAESEFLNPFYKEFPWLDNLPKKQ